MTKNRKRKCDDLEDLNREDLLDRARKLSIHNTELKNALKKQGSIGDTEFVKKKKGREFDFSKCFQRKVLFRFYYLGWDYHGFACQDNSTATIEHHLFAALRKTCLIEDRESSNYHRCGRTDKGVSAFGQVISINVRSRFRPEDQLLDDSIANELQYCTLLNRVLPENIRMIAWLPLRNPKFSARFDCVARTYRYFFPRGSLDILAMEQAAEKLIGVHDFRNLCKMDVANGVVAFKRSIETARIARCSPGPEENEWDMLYLEIRGKAFLWHQIRCIMSILLTVGEGKEKPEIVRDLLDVDTNPQKPQYTLARDVPLNLYDVEYRDHSEEDPGEELIKEDLKWIHDSENVDRMVSALQQQWSLFSIKAEMIKSMVGDIARYGSGNSVRDQAIGLIEGVRTKQHVPLLKRPKCNSLESRIEHYVKKKRLVIEVAKE